MEIVDLTDDNDVINNVIHDSNKFVNLVDDDSDVDDGLADVPIGRALDITKAQPLTPNIHIILQI